MSLAELVDDILTDKNTVHSYIELYESLFQNKKESAKNVLEIGIGDFNDKNGGSLKLWHDYFTNANIHGIDILSPDRIIDELQNNNRVVLYTETDGYDETFFNNTFLEKNIKFDILLDDGPHTYESMVQFIKLYSQVMAEDGILIIEDVQDWEWIDNLYHNVPDELKPYVEICDLRHVKNRYDDIVFIINKSKKLE
jgi:spermidine synthase